MSLANPFNKETQSIQWCQYQGAMIDTNSEAEHALHYVSDDYIFENDYDDVV